MAETKTTKNPVVLVFKVDASHYHSFQIEGWRVILESKMEVDHDGKITCNCHLYRFSSKCPHIKFADPIAHVIRNRDKRTPISPTELEEGMVGFLDVNKDEMSIVDPTLPNMSTWNLLLHMIGDKKEEGGEGSFNPNRIFEECKKSAAEGAAFADKSVRDAGTRVAPFIVPEEIKARVSFDDSLGAASPAAAAAPAPELVDATPEEVAEVAAPTVSTDPFEIKPASTRPRKILWRVVARPKPENFYVDDDTWRALCYGIDMQKNVLLVGPSGCGKSELLYIGAKGLKRIITPFNMGAMSEPRLSLIGATHFSRHKSTAEAEAHTKDVKEESEAPKEPPKEDEPIEELESRMDKELEEAGTWFNPSRFVRSVTTPWSVVLLDEVSRAVQSATNILFPLMDRQGYLPLDESEDAGIIKRAEGVVFVGTANVGMQFTGTEEIDSAFMQRFPIVIDVDFPPPDPERDVLLTRCANLGRRDAKRLIDIAVKQRAMYKAGDFTNGISTRMLIAAGEAVGAGLKFDLACKVCIENQFKSDGGDDSERANIKKIIQKDEK